MKNQSRFLKRWGCMLGVTVLFCLNSLDGMAAGKSGFKPTGHAELDAIRQLISSQKTNQENYKLRIFMLKQWMCTLQQMGANTEPFLDVSEVFIQIFPWNLFASHGEEKGLSPEEEAQLYPAIDEGYRILENIYSECNPLTKEPVRGGNIPQSAAPSVSEKERFGLSKVKRRPKDWPLYQKSNQHTGSAETDHILSGKEADLQTR